MKLRFTITDLLIFVTAIGAYIAVVTQSQFILWHIAAASGLMGLLAGSVMGACYGGRHRAVAAGVIGAALLCLYAVWSAPNYWLNAMEADHMLGLAVCALCGAIPLASVGALFSRSNGEILGWTVWNCALTGLVPCAVLWLVMLAHGIAESIARPAKSDLLWIVFVAGLLGMSAMSVFASGVGAAVAISGVLLRAVGLAIQSWTSPKSIQTADNPENATQQTVRQPL